MLLNYLGGVCIMNLKKGLASFAALTLVISATACGGSDSSDSSPSPAGTAGSSTAPAATTSASPAAGAADLKPESGASLVIWESREERAFTDDIAKQFTAKYNIPVKIEEVPPTDQVAKLTQDGPSGLGADVVIIPNDNLGKAVEASLLLPNDVFKDDTVKNNTPASITGSTIKGTLYGYPRSTETYALFYNKSYVKEAPKTWEDVIAFSKTFTDKSKNKYGIMWEVGNMYFSYPFIASTGGYLFGSNGTDKNDIGLNNAGALEGLKVFASLREYLPVKSGDITADIKRSLFTKGDVAMDIVGPWELATYKAALGDKLGLAPIPTINGKKAISFSGIKLWSVNSFTKYPKAAKLFAQFASTKEAQLLLNKNVGSVPTNLAALEDAQIKNDPFVYGFAEQAKNSQPMPSIPEMGNVWSPVNAALPDIWDIGKDPKAAMDSAVQQIKDLNNGATK
jgi:arabinogalactan oligomer / maltooligosaccharide transport system substrate-binding protein